MENLVKEFDDAIAKAANMATPVVGAYDLGRPYAQMARRDVEAQIDYTIMRLIRCKDKIAQSAGESSSLLPLLREYLNGINLRAQARWLEAHNGGIDEAAYDQLWGEIQEIQDRISGAATLLGSASIVEARAVNG